METKLIQVTDEMRASGVTKITVNEMSSEEAAASADRILLEAVVARAREIRIDELARTMISDSEEDFRATLARISK